MKKIFLIILISLTLTPLLSRAQEYKLIEPLPCIANTGNNCGTGETINKISLNTYIDYVFKFSIALAAFLAVVMIIYGGFLYMTSEIPGVKSDGKEKITNAIFGLIMILASYLILQTIDPRLVEVTTEIKPVEVKTESLELFSSQLANELDTLSLQSVRELQNIKYKNLERQERIAALQARLDDQESEPLTEAEYTELEKLKLEVSKGLVQENKLKAAAIGQVNYARVYDIIHNSSSTLDRTQLKIAEDTIKEGYDQKISNINKIDTAEGERMKRQKDFYLNQIREEEEIARNANVLSGQVIKGNIYVKFLEEKLEETKIAMANPAKVIVLGITLDQYTRMMQARIDLIEKVLKKK